MATEVPNNTPLAAKRGQKRSRLVMAAKLLTAIGELDVRLRDLSCAGALAETQNPPREGSEVVLVCGGTVVPARVAWVIGRRLGLDFHHPIAEEQVAAQVGLRKLT